MRTINEIMPPVPVGDVTILIYRDSTVWPLELLDKTFPHCRFREIDAVNSVEAVERFYCNTANGFAGAKYGEQHGGAEENMVAHHWLDLVTPTLVKIHNEQKQAREADYARIEEQAAELQRLRGIEQLARKRNRGRPPLSETEETIIARVSMPESMHKHCMVQPGGLAAHIRTLVEADRKTRE